MPVETWIEDFYGEHHARHPGLMLPAPGTKQAGIVIKGMQANFKEQGIHDYEIATEASIRLMAVRLKHPRDAWPELLDTAAKIHQGRSAALGIAAARPAVYDTAEAAADASAGCEWCGGMGRATVYAVDPDARPKTALALCECPLGQWVTAKWTTQARDVLARTPRVAHVRDDDRTWSLTPPGWENHVPDTYRHPFTLDQIRAMTTRARAEDVQRMPVGRPRRATGSQTPLTSPAPSPPSSEPATCSEPSQEPTRRE